MKPLQWFLTAILGLALVFVMVDRWIALSAASSTFTTAAKIPPAQAILVPGARIYAGEVSGILAQRLDAAIDIHRLGKAKTILVSGDYSSRYYDEAEAMKKYLVRHGIASGSIVLDHAGFSTYDSVYRAQHVFDFRSVIIVSQDFHLPRALFIARWLGLPALGYSASKIPLSAEQIFRSEWREPLARLKAIYDIARHALPAFTGSGLPLDASGTVLRW